MDPKIRVMWLRAAAWCTTRTYEHKSYFAWRMDPDSGGDAVYHAFAFMAKELLVKWPDQKFGGQDVVAAMKHDGRPMFRDLKRTRLGICDNSWLRPLAIEAAALNPELIRWLNFQKPKAAQVPDRWPPVPPSIAKARAANKLSFSEYAKRYPPVPPTEYAPDGAEYF